VLDVASDVDGGHAAHADFAVDGVAAEDGGVEEGDGFRRHGVASAAGSGR
jgi:hypothetical protein